MKDRDLHLSSMPHSRHLKKRQLGLQQQREEQEVTAAGENASRSSPSSHEHIPPSSSPSPNGERPLGVKHHPTPPSASSSSSPPPQPPLRDPWTSHHHQLDAIAAEHEAAAFAKDAARVGGQQQLVLQLYYEQLLRQHPHAALLAREQERGQLVGRGRLIHPSPQHSVGAQSYHHHRTLAALQEYQRWKEAERRRELTEEELRHRHALMQLQLHRSQGLVMQHLTPQIQRQALASTGAGGLDDGSVHHQREGEHTHKDNLHPSRQPAMEDGHWQHKEWVRQGKVEVEDHRGNRNQYHGQQQQRTSQPQQPSKAPAPQPLPELPFPPTPGTYTCDLLLEGRRSTPTPSELARSLRCAYGLLLGPSMGTADPLVPAPEMVGEGARGNGAPLGPGPGPSPQPPATAVGGVFEEPTSSQSQSPPPPRDVLSEILSLPQACFLTILPHDPPRVVVAHSLGRYHPPSSFPGDVSDPYRNRIVAFVGERSGVVGGSSGGKGGVVLETPSSTAGGGTPRARTDVDEDGQLLDDVIAGGDHDSGAPLPSVFAAPRRGVVGSDVDGGAAEELFGPKRYSLIPRDALDECYGGGVRGGGGGDNGGSQTEDDGGHHRQDAKSGRPSPGDKVGNNNKVGTSSNPTDYDVEAGGGVEEAFLTKLAYIPPSWAVHFLGGMGPYQALLLATRLVEASFTDPMHRRAAEPLLRWLRLACQSDPLRGDSASAASVDWTPVMDDGGSVRGYAVRRMRFSMRATAAIAAEATAGGSGGGGGGGGDALGRGPKRELLTQPRREMMLDDHYHDQGIGGEPGGGDAADVDLHLEGSRGAIVDVAKDEGEEEQSPNKNERRRSGSPPLKKRCRVGEHTKEKEDRSEGGPPAPSPPGATGVNLGSAFAAHRAKKQKDDDWRLKEAFTGTAIAAVPRHPPSSPTPPRDEEDSKHRGHHALPEGGGEGTGIDHPPVVSASTSSSSSGDSSSTQLPTRISAFAAPPPTSSTQTGGDDDLGNDSPSPPPLLPPRIIDRHLATNPSSTTAPPESAEEARGGHVEVEFRASSVGSISASPSLSCRQASSAGGDDATSPQVKRECHDDDDGGRDGGIKDDVDISPSPAMVEKRPSERVDGDDDGVPPRFSPSPTRDIGAEGEKGRGEGEGAVAAVCARESNEGRVGDQDGVTVSPSPRLWKVGGCSVGRRDDDGGTAEGGRGEGVNISAANSSSTTFPSTSESGSKGKKMEGGDDPKGPPSSTERTEVSKGGRRASSSPCSVSKNGASGGKIGRNDQKAEPPTERETAISTADDDAASSSSPASTSKGIADGRKGGGEYSTEASLTEGATTSPCDHESGSSSSSRDAYNCGTNGRERGHVGRGDPKMSMPAPSSAEEGAVAVSSTGRGVGGDGGSRDNGCSESATAASHGFLQQKRGGQGTTTRRYSNPANNKNTTTTRREQEQFELEFINVTMLDAQEVADRIFGHDGVRHRQFMRETQCRVYLRGRGRACAKFPFRRGEDDTQVQVILQGRTRFSVNRAKSRVMSMLSDLMSRVSSASHQSPAGGVLDGGMVNHHGHRPNSPHAPIATAAAGQKRDYEDSQLNRYTGNDGNFAPETGNPGAGRQGVHHFGGRYYGPSVPSQQQYPATSRRGSGHFPERYGTTCSARGGYAGTDQRYYQGYGWNDGYYGGGDRTDTYGTGWSSVRDQYANGRSYGCDADEHGGHSERNAMPTSTEKKSKNVSGLGLVTRSVRLAEMCSFPDKMVDFLIGRCGEGLKSLRESTYCLIDIDRTTMVVKITGKTDERVNKALQLVKERCRRHSS